MTDSRGSIPGRSEIPLHIGIVSEQLAFGIESDIVLVAVSHTEDFPVLTAFIDVTDPTAGRENPSRVSVRIPATRQQMIFVPVARNAAAGDLFGQLRMVASSDEQRFAIRAECDGMRTMFAAAGNEHAVFIAIDQAVIICISQTMQA